MHIVYFDSGTTNTRVYLIADLQVIDVIKEDFGSRDVSITGNDKLLLHNLKMLYYQLLDKNRLKDIDIERIYASGMVTCPFGITEIPHLSTPVSLEKLRDGIHQHFEQEFFNRSIFLIRGVKTLSEGFPLDTGNIAEVNNVRGEEIESFGLLSILPHEYAKSNLVVIFPGSHTHIIYLSGGVIKDILSTFSGELYHAIASDTVFSASIKNAGRELISEMVILGYECLKKYGFNRAIYIAHAIKIFDVSDNIGIRSYINGVISAGMVLALKKTMRKKWRKVENIIVAGSNDMVYIDEMVLKYAIKGIRITPIVVSDIDSFAVRGMLEIIKQE